MDNLFYIIQLLIGASFVYILFNSYKIFNSNRIAFKYKEITGTYMLPSESKNYHKNLITINNFTSNLGFLWSIIGLLSSNYVFYILFFVIFGILKLSMYICRIVTKNDYSIASYIIGCIFITFNIILIFTILFNKYHYQNNLTTLWFL